MNISPLSPPRRNVPVLALHVPEPRYRPGDTPDFSDIAVPTAGLRRAPRRPPRRAIRIR